MTVLREASSAAAAQKTLPPYFSSTRLMCRRVMSASRSGRSDKNIARAFTLARDEKAVLVFDEADNFLRSRKHAVRS